MRYMNEEDEFGDDTEYIDTRCECGHKISYEDTIIPGFKMRDEDEVYCDVCGKLVILRYRGSIGNIKGAKYKHNI